MNNKALTSDPFFRTVYGLHPKNWSKLSENFIYTKTGPVNEGTSHHIANICYLYT